MKGVCVIQNLEKAKLKDMEQINLKITFQIILKL